MRTQRQLSPAADKPPDKLCSAMCHNPTHAPQQRASLENLVSTAGQWQRNCNAERAGGLHVDVQLDLGYLLDRQIGRFFALEYASGINACLTMRLKKAACVTHQATRDS